jgi:RNA ligase
MSTKYNRSLHAHISLGSTSDDRFMPKGYVEKFANMEQLILTEKLDGQNNCFSKNGLYARSHAAPSELPWDRPLLERWRLIKDSLGGLELFGENMYGIHSIAYKHLESYFYLFAVRDGDAWLSWEEVKEVAMMYDFPTVPQITITVPLSQMKGNFKDENHLLAEWFRVNLGMTWGEYTQSEGMLGGYDTITGEVASEGFVVRNAKGFETNGGVLAVAPNEFDNLFKVVRNSHVQTDTHWTKNWKSAVLRNYDKYGWYGYEYLSKR